MKKSLLTPARGLLALALLAMPAVASASRPSSPAASIRQLTVNTHPGAAIQPTMYGIFFEDINFGADGGLYAELVENRSFEYPQNLMGWSTFGNVAVGEKDPAFPRCPHYVVLESAGHAEKRTGLENRGYFGMGLKKGMKYDFSVWGRLHLLNGKEAKIRVEIIGPDNNIIDAQTISVKANRWRKYTATLTSKVTVGKGFMRVFLEGDEAVDLDHISLMPADNWHGLRADLVKDLEDLHPGVFRFPGGCIVEGTNLTTRYQWKNTVGPAENRPLNENRWRDTFPYRLFPNYYQSYGLGFYEFFLLSEKIGATPLPVLSVGLSCQFQNKDDDPNAHVAVDDLQPYIDDALDLIEFANGDTTTTWGSLRARMGHPAPFHLKEIGIGNEQWGKLYPERLEKFIRQIRAKYPDIKICGSSGPSASGDNFDYGWKEMRRLGTDLVDEHYYMDPKWFLSQAGRYDDYPRTGPKVFAGEYACHVKGVDDQPTVAKNNFEAALCEAAFMTGLERNADVVYQATYAPLFAHVEGWQWRPDLIWFDNLKSVRSVNWYVQMLYSTNKGTHVLQLTEDGKPVEGHNSLYASAVYDKTKDGYIVKVANVSDRPQQLSISFQGAKKLGEFTALTLHSDDLKATNSLEHPMTVVPIESKVQAQGSVLTVTVPANSFVVYRQ